MKSRVIAIACLLAACSVVWGEEDISRLLEQQPHFQQRLEAYERLLEMRRARGLRHLPPATQFEFARQRYLQPHAPGATGANGCAWSSAGPTNLNGRVTAIAIDPGNNQRIYATTFGGIFRSLDAGRRWQRVSDNWLATVFSSIAINPTNTKEIFAGGGDKDLNPSYTGDGLWRSDSAGAPGSWTKVLSGGLIDTFANTVVYRIRVDPAWPYNVYVAASNGIWLGTRNGATFNFTRMGNCNAVVDDVAVDFSVTPRNVYMAVREGPGAVSIPSFPRGIYKWDNASNQWKKKDTGIETVDTEVILLALAPSNPSVLYAKVTQTSGHHQGFYRSTTAAEGDPAWTMTKDSPKLGHAGDFSWFCNSVEVDSINEWHVISSGCWPFVTPDGGETFTQIDAGMDPNYEFQVHGDMHTAAFDPKNPNIVYVGNDGGIDKSTDMSNPNWHWTDSSHGMVATMFWNLTSNRNFPTTIAGGSQDNGIDITFGNRTWYRPVWCDGLDVGTDAKHPITLYASCNGGLTEFINPIPGTDHGGETVPFASPVPKGPLATDVILSGRAIAAAAGPTACDADRIVTTVDGKTWTYTNASFPAGARVVALAIAPSSGFKTFLAAVQPASGCPSFVPFVTWSDNGGFSWNPTFGLPGLTGATVAFDPKKATRAYVMYEGLGKNIYMATSGFKFSSITGTAPTALPSGATRIAVDPSDSNVLYAATPVGVFRGVIPISTPFDPPTAEWTPFDEGLPDGLDVNDIWVDPTLGILTIGTFGHGAYRRNITPGVTCTPRMLVVRDNVYDDGREPDATTGWPDAEHPIKDLSKPGFYKPDDTIGGRVWWYTSRDIRIDVPSLAPHQNQIENADHVEFEICPITAWPCEAGGMLDLPPMAGKEARVYVQVTNGGLEPVNKTRVIALWTKSGTGFPDLPEDFWKTTFPFDKACGPLDESTGWHLVDKVAPCRMINSINPEVPELARFDWSPGFNEDGGATILTVVESADDPIVESIRKENKLDPSEIVPGSRHIALRNIKIVPFDAEVRDPFLWPIDFPHVPVEPLGEFEIVVSKPDLREAVRIVLPAGVTARAGLDSARQTRITEPELVRRLETMRLDPTNAWELNGDDASLFVTPRSGQRTTAGVIATPANANASSRFHLTQRNREKVVGGMMFLFRPQSER